MLDMHTPLSLKLRQWFSIGVFTYLLTYSYTLCALMHIMCINAILLQVLMLTPLTLSSQSQ